ncbi:hypothetical protein HRI_004914700 [Hibiscus trionum]|uniref:Uncharacterized protein n=1 Tax=Hibiscus trionum TaxID=183268 RepID=A0A9W7JDD1_HIBTR|nr:hypothetical protein HRI_004914700 [Hibiscus trionum]
MGVIREIQVASAAHKLFVYELDDVYDSVTGRPLTGSWVWESSLLLSHWMSTHLNVEGKTVIELGAGAGLPGLTAALLGATRVVLTDVQQLLPGLLNNVEANGFMGKIGVRELVWGSDESVSEMTFDIVLMSDVLYDSEAMIGLGKTLKRVCGEGTQVWAATEMRPWTGECLDQLTAQGFQVVELETSQLSATEDGGTWFAIIEIKPPVAENSVSQASHVS